MKFKHERWVLSLVGLCLLLWGIKAVQHAREPKYQGKTVAEWYAEVKSIDEIWVMKEGQFAREPSTIGLKQLGTNAVWFLWYEHRRKDSPLLAGVMRQQERFDPPTGVYWFNHEQKRREIAQRLLEEFGAEAEVLIPEILERLKSRDQRERELMANLLGSIRRQPEVVVPALVESLPAMNRSLVDSFAQIRALGQFGPAASACVPELRARLARPVNQRPGFQVNLARTILLINGPGPEVEILTKRLKPGDYESSWLGTGALSDVGTNARSAAPVLIRFSQTLTNAGESNQVMTLVRQIDPEGVYTQP